MTSSVTLQAVTEGQTIPYDVQLTLKLVGSLTFAAFDATGMTVTSILRDKNGTLVSVATSWFSQTTSIARLDPVAGTFVFARRPYFLKFRIVDGTGDVSFYPQDDYALIPVYAA